MSEILHCTDDKLSSAYIGCVGVTGALLEGTKIWVHLSSGSDVELMNRVFGSLFRKICCTKIEKKIIAPTKNTNQMIMSMRDELHLIGKGVPEPYKNQEEIELFKCKL